MIKVWNFGYHQILMNIFLIFKMGVYFICSSNLNYSYSLFLLFYLNKKKKKLKFAGHCSLTIYNPMFHYLAFEVAYPKRKRKKEALEVVSSPKRFHL